jgi:glycosyltransferase involved in cell wall biosynthesis
VRIAVVGAAHPYKGGIAAHTTSTAHHLAEAGHDVLVVSWSRLYPHRLYPGEQAIPGGGHDVPPFPATVRPLRWDRPGTWWRTGCRLRDRDLVIVQAVVPAQVPALLALIRAARSHPAAPGVATAGDAATSGGAATAGDAATSGGPRIAVIAHNVVPHEAHPGAGWLMGRLLRAADLVVTHSAEQARLAREHGARVAVAAELPPHLPGGVPDGHARASLLRRRESDLPAPEDGVPAGPVRLLSFGIVRHYKGVDLLLDAVRAVDGVRVTVAGELWGVAGERVRAMAADPDLAGRVDLRPGYVAAEDLPGMLAAHDVLTLTYRSATGSQNVQLAHAYGLPVLATRVGTFADQVRDGVDGLLVPADDVAALTCAVRRLSQPGVLATLRAGVPELDTAGPWQSYVTTLTGAHG